MSDFNIVFNHTVFGVDNAKTETHTLSHLVAKQQAIAWPHQKRWEQSKKAEYN
ncbi:MAG: hypothetical protein ABR607_09285 [Pyrinomonadaceae bacterium]